MTKGGLTLAAVLLLAAPVEAQTLILCDADWMDAERVLALITVEVEEPARYVFKVTDCHAESAHVSVRGPEGLDRQRDVRLASTAPEARSRLVALVLVELIRLGARRDPPAADPPEDEPAVDPGSAEEPPEPDGGVAEEEVEPDADVEGLRFPPASDPYGPPEAAETEGSPLPRAPNPYGPLRLPPAPDPYGPVESAARVDPPPRGYGLDDDGSGGELGPCEGTGLAARSSDRRCSRALGVAIGVARHHLRQQAGASLWPMQVRLRYRWRFLFFGGRVAGRIGQSAPWSGAEVNVSSYTAAFGLELASKRFESALLAFAASAEVGAIRYRERSSGGGCADPAFCDEPQSQGARSTFGAMLALRLEIPIGAAAIFAEVEGGWTRGLMVGSFHEAVTGVGGGQLSFLLGVAFGPGGES